MGEKGGAEKEGRKEERKEMDPPVRLARRQDLWRQTRRQDLRVKLPTKSPPRLCRAQDLGAKINDDETCKLGATNDGAELRVQILKAYL